MANVKICDMRSCKKVLGNDPFQQPIIIMSKSYDLCSDCLRHLREFVESKLTGGYPILEHITIEPPNMWPDPMPYPNPDSITYAPIISTPTIAPHLPLPELPPVQPLQDDVSNGRLIWSDNSSSDTPPFSRPRGNSGT